jgi:hypothetical protein
MSWMLQPHNYGQALSRNLYNVGYRRTATYKGMGALGLNCPGDPGCYGYVPPDPGAPVDPVVAQLAQMQAEIDALFGYTGAGQAPAPTVNYTPWLILGGGLLLVMMTSRR